MSKLAKALGIAVVALTLVGASQAQSNSRQIPFVAGGRVNIELEAGGYRIKPSTDANLRVTWEGGSLERSDVKVDLDAHGNTAKITVSNTPHHNFRATIEVPAKTHLQVRLTAGDLRVAGITGDKDIESNAGNVIIEVNDANEYARAEASVLAGDLSAPAFHINKGGLFRSFDWSGPGMYTLRVHLLAGDLVLRSGGAKRAAEM